MKILFRVALLLAEVCLVRAYNILSLDSAQYKGLVQTKFLDEIEKYAFEVTQANDCLPELAQYKDKKRIPTNKIFDMIAGSESGAILASVALEGKDISVASTFFLSEVDKFYNFRQFPFFIKCILTVVSMIVIAILSFFWYEKQFDFPNFDELTEMLQSYIKLKKKHYKKHESADPVNTKDQYYKNLHSKITKIFDDVKFEYNENDKGKYKVFKSIIAY